MSVGLAAAASDRPHDRRRKQQFILREQIDVAVEFGLGDQAQFDQFISNLFEIRAGKICSFGLAFPHKKTLGLVVRFNQFERI
jgi:hypothetical protein